MDIKYIPNVLAVAVDQDVIVGHSIAQDNYRPIFAQVLPEEGAVDTDVDVVLLVVVADPDLVVVDGADGKSLNVRMTDTQIRERQDFAIEQNMTTLRNRVDQLGVAEPLVQRQGVDRDDRARQLVAREALVEEGLQPASGRRIQGRNDGSQEESAVRMDARFRDLARCFGIEPAVQRNNAAKGRHRIAAQRLFVGVFQRRAFGDAAVMLLFLLLVGRYLDRLMRARARSARTAPWATRPSCHA